LADAPRASLFTLETLVDLDKCQQGNLCRNLSPFDLMGKGLGPWLSDLLSQFGVGQSPVIKGVVKPGAILEGRIYVAEGAVVEPTGYIQGPCFVGPKAEVRHGAYIRGNVYIGPFAVVGHTSEVKNSVLFDHAKAAHFAYVGDSILGRNVNLGAGTKLANLPLKRGDIRYKDPVTGMIKSSGLGKLGALMGDGSQTGCNAVLSPGTILMPETMVLPCSHFRGTLLEGRYP
jgi:NDP-sugar pyrophosphorylase family protein